MNGNTGMMEERVVAYFKVSFQYLVEVVVKTITQDLRLSGSRFIFVQNLSTISLSNFIINFLLNYIHIFLPDNLTVAQLFIYSPCSQELNTLSCREPNQSSPQFYVDIFNIQFQHTCPIYA